MVSYRIEHHGASRSFPEPHAFLQGAREDGAALVLIGAGAGRAYRADPSRPLILIELGQECLGVHTGEEAGREGGNVLGFARVRIGTGAPGEAVELVHQPATAPAAIAAAESILAAAGLTVALCSDAAGRIVDRLLRPYLNDALRALDAGLASAADIDTTVRLGLGHRRGPIELLEATGLADHHDVTAALFATYGERALAPARRAVVAKARQMKE